MIESLVGKCGAFRLIPQVFAADGADCSAVEHYVNILMTLQQPPFETILSTILPDIGSAKQTAIVHGSMLLPEKDISIDLSDQEMLKTEYDALIPTDLLMEDRIAFTPLIDKIFGEGRIFASRKDLVEFLNSKDVHDLVGSVFWWRRTFSKIDILI